jgi:hypothetical protein
MFEQFRKFDTNNDFHLDSEEVSIFIICIMFRWLIDS